MQDKIELILSNRKIFLDDIVDLSDSSCVLDEVGSIINKSFPEIDFHYVDMAHSDVLRLFAGEYPGYKECSTGYHDLRHTMEVFLAMTRIIHGAHLDGVVLDSKEVLLSLISALLHDTGYILTVDDDAGTGGKYTLTHVERSIDFMREYFEVNGFSDEDADKASHIIKCTSLAANFKEIPFASPGVETLAKMLFAADLIGQMADRTYLEKLHLLYYEFVEGDITEFVNEEALLRSTIDFVDAMREKIMMELNLVSGYLQMHFKARCNINRDLYAESIGNNMDYLKQILSDESDDYRSKLNRQGILKRIENLVDEAE